MHDRININGFTYDKLAHDFAFEGQEVVHEVASVRGDGSDICTCGLVIQQGADLLQVLGHIDPVSKQPVKTYVLHVPKQAYYQILCRDCSWRQIRPTLQLATACRRQHECPPVMVNTPPFLMRTRGDFLGAALDRTGWTVAADDPRAEQFLDRTIELCREQDEGRINIDTVYETLRREFPLM
jgi:hypothetical protein